VVKKSILIRVPEDTGTKYERILYPAGEVQIRLKHDTVLELFDADSVVVYCRAAHQNVWDLALLADAIFHLCPFKESTLVLPYLPFSRADRRFVEGDCHGLKVFGEYLSSLRFHRIRTLDVHSFRAAKNIDNLVNISPRPLITKVIADICDGGGHPVVLLPDKGAQRYGLDGAFQASKIRDPETGRLFRFDLPDNLPKDHDILIVDDICDGGGTFIGIANTLEAFRERKKYGKLYLYVTHGIFSKGLQPLCEKFERVYTTNSLNPEAVASYGGLFFPNGRLKVLNCEPLLLEG